MKPQQKELLKKLKGELKYGDNTLIAKRTAFTPEYVGMCLNPRNDSYNSVIVEEALKLVQEREEELKAQMEKLNNL